MTHSRTVRRSLKRAWLTATLIIVVGGVVLGVTLMGDGDSKVSADVPHASGSLGSSAGEAPSAVAPSMGAPAPVGERSDADNYRADVVACNSAIGQQLDALTRQLVNVKYSDAGWADETNVILGRMAATADQARDIRPTPDFAESHAVWLEGIESYAWVADNMGSAIADRDDELLMKCSERLAIASGKFKEAAGLMARVAVD